LLTDGLGTRWESLNIWFKMFPCHVTAQAPVRAIRELQREHRFGPQDVTRIVIEASEKVLSHHAERAPQDVGTAQYSVPFSVALALFRDPADPRAFLDGPQQNPAILDLCKRIELRRYEGRMAVGHNASCRIEVFLADGRSVAIAKTDFDEGDGDESLEQRVQRKFLNLSAALGDDKRQTLLARLKAIEHQDNMAQLLAL
jgi:2-methylcitrate dehydratase PrpD